MIRTEILWKIRVLLGGLRVGKKVKAGARVTVSDCIVDHIEYSIDTEKKNVHQAELREVRIL